MRELSREEGSAFAITNFSATHRSHFRVQPFAMAISSSYIPTDLALDTKSVGI